MEHLVFIDLETIPSGPPVDMATQPPPKKMSKPETIEKWRKSEGAADEIYRSRSLNSMEGEIFCIGYAVGDEPVMVECQEEGEELLMMTFISSLKARIDLRESVIWVGHNILTFDMAWLWRRAIKYDLPMFANMIKLDRYKHNIHDTMVMWRGADFKDYTSLDDLARWLGLGETVGSGADVYDQYLAGEYEKIINHCKMDVELTRKIYKKIRGY